MGVTGILDNKRYCNTNVKHLIFNNERKMEIRYMLLYRPVYLYCLIPWLKTMVTGIPWPIAM